MLLWLARPQPTDCSISSDSPILRQGRATTRETWQSKKLLKKNLEAVLASIPGYEVFFFDESRFGTHSRIGHGWFRKGSRTAIKKKLGFKNFYLYTAASPKTGDEFTLLMPYVNTEALNVYLREMSSWLKDRKACFIMDQAGWHKANGLVVPENIKIVYLPPYSPELNPVERLWLYIKDNILKNEIYDDLPLLENAVCDFIKTLTPKVIKSVCNVNYMPYYL